MAAPKRTKAQREADLAEIAHLYCTGWRQVDIADRIGVSQVQISLDLKAIFAEWRKQRAGDITAWTNAELAKINALELEYWEAWRRSCEDRTRTVKGARVTPRGEGKETATSATTTTETLLGNPSFLAGVQWCIERRCKILGIDAPVKVAPTTPDGANPYAGMSDDALRAELVRYALSAVSAGDAPHGTALSLDDERPPESTAATG